MGLAHEYRAAEKEISRLTSEKKRLEDNGQSTKTVEQQIKAAREKKREIAEKIDREAAEMEAVK